MWLDIEVNDAAVRVGMVVVIPFVGPIAICFDIVVHEIVILTMEKKIQRGYVDHYGCLSEAVFSDPDVDVF